MNIDPVLGVADGFFVVPADAFVKDNCFFDIYLAHDRKDEEYRDSRYDAENVEEEFIPYSVLIPAKNGDLYFTVESYPFSTVPTDCTSGTVFITPNDTETAFQTTAPVVYFAVYNSNNMVNPIGYQFYIE